MCNKSSELHMISWQMAHILPKPVQRLLGSMAVEPVEREQACRTKVAADVDIRVTTQIKADNRQGNKRATAESPRQITAIPTSGRPLNLKLHR